MGKSKDTRVIADMNTIEKSMEISYIENVKYPMPDNPVTITWDNEALWYQGKLWEVAISNIDSLTKTPEDPNAENKLYTYSVTTDQKKYNIWSITTDSATAYNPYLNEVYTNTYKSIVRWNYNDKFIIKWAWANKKIYPVPSLIVDDPTKYITWFSSWEKIYFVTNKWTNYNKEYKNKTNWTTLTNYITWKIWTWEDITQIAQVLTWAYENFNEPTYEKVKEMDETELQEEIDRTDSVKVYDDCASTSHSWYNIPYIWHGKEWEWTKTITWWTATIKASCNDWNLNYGSESASCNTWYYNNNWNCEAWIIWDDTNWRKWADGTYAKSCNEYKNTTPSWYVYDWAIWDWVYWIKPDTDPAFKVYCDMTTDWGGWTLQRVNIKQQMWCVHEKSGDWCGDLISITQSNSAGLSDEKIRSIYHANGKTYQNAEFYMLNELNYHAIFAGLVKEYTYYPGTDATKYRKPGSGSRQTNSSYKGSSAKDTRTRWINGRNYDNPSYWTYAWNKDTWVATKASMIEGHGDPARDDETVWGRHRNGYNWSSGWTTTWTFVR